MSILKIIIRALICMAIIASVCSFTAPAEKTRLNITIAHFVGTSALNLDDSVYKNALGQTFTISRFRYYLSDVKLKNANGKEFQWPGYFLVDEAEPESKKIILTDVPVGKYTSISFTIGVDSLHNCNGAQSGALDPVNGMFWTWNTGYIFLKLEGHANTSTSPGHIFEYHIGGYVAPNNCIRKVTLNLNHADLAGGCENKIAIMADILELLKTPTTIDFSNLSSVTDFHNATLIADNYKNMFRVLWPVWHHY